MPIDPREVASAPAGPVAVEVPGRTAMLMVKLAEQIGASTPGEVVGQAIGLLQLVTDAKSRGQRILIRDPESGHEVDLAL